MPLYQKCKQFMWWCYLHLLGGIFGSDSRKMNLCQSPVSLSSTLIHTGRIFSWWFSIARFLGPQCSHMDSTPNLHHHCQAVAVAVMRRGTRILGTGTTGGTTRSRFAASLRGFYGRGALRGCLTITSSFFTSWHNNSQGEQRSFQKDSSLIHELSHRFLVPNKILFPSALQTPLTQPTPWLGDAWQSKIKIYHHHIIVIITSLNHHHHFISSSIRKQVVDKVEGTWTPRPLNTPPSLPCGRLYFRPIWSGRSLIHSMRIQILSH